MRRRWENPLLGLALLVLAAPVQAQDLELHTFSEAPEPLRDELRQALYEEVELLGEPVLSPRPTAEARRRLESLAGKRPSEAVLHRYLGRALDDLGEHKAAANAFRRAEALAPEALWPLEDLAVFHASRGNWTGELGALKRLAARQQSMLDVPGTSYELAKTWTRIAVAIEAHQLDEDPLSYRRQAAEVVPSSYGASERVIRWLVSRGRLEDAVDQFPWARRTWPEHHTDLAIFEMDLLFRLERTDEIRAVLRREIALDEGRGSNWLWQSYAERLRRRGELEAELRRVRSLLRGGPLTGVELAEAAHLLRAAGNRSEAERAVRRSLDNADRASDEDMLILASLLRHLDRHDEAVQVLYALAATNRGEVRDEAQVRLALLLAERRGPVRPSGLRALLDPAHLDPGPSVTGGLLSLLWGGPPGSEVARELERRDQRHLQAAWSARLIEDVQRRRPGWSKLAQVELRLIDAYRSQGARRATLQASRRFLERHPDHEEYYDVGIDTARLMEASGQNGLALLRRLARAAADRGDDRHHRLVLRSTAALLVSERRHEEVVPIYWAAIEARPQDSNLYQNFLDFLDRHNLHDEQQRVYQRALEHFAGSDWASRYARWTLRRRGREASEELVRRLVADLPPDVVSGLLQRAAETGPRGTEAQRFFLEIHREALRRHPGNLELVRRLVAYYDRYPDTHGADRLSLLVRYAPYDARLRDALYVTLAREGRVSSALEELAAQGSVAGRLLAVDFSIRRAEQRAARPILASLAGDLPSGRDLHLRLVALEDSLGNGERAREVLAGLLAHWPWDPDLLTRAGELALARGDLDGARHLWARIHEARPGDAGAYRQTATLLWDYYLFDDALRTLIAAREAVGDEHLFAFELASVHESAGNREPAVREYVRVLADAARQYEVWPPHDMRPRPPRWRGPATGVDDLDGLDSRPESDDMLIHVRHRLVQLASREGDWEIVEEVMRDVMAASPEDHGLVHVRIDLLQATGRWDDAYQLLADAALRINHPSLQDRAVRELTAAGRDREATAVLRRLAQNRPMDLTPTYRLADFLEQRGHIRAAASALSGLADRLGEDENRGRDQEAVTARLARLYYAHQLYDEAVATARRAVAMAQGSRQSTLRLELARWLVRLERPAEAAETIEPVLAEEPTDSAALDVYASALVALGRAGGRPRQEVVEGLIRSFDAAVEATRASGDGSEHTRGQVRNLRLTLVRHLLELGAHRAVRDQHIALLNDDLENEALLLRAYRHAAAHDLVESLERRYRTDAERSPRDHRLPLVLARLAAARGDTETAVAQMERSLAIAPERLDLRRELIGYLVQQLDWTDDGGGWREAARQYHELAELQRARGGDVTRWIAEEARMYGRVGDWEAMDEAIERLVAESPNEPARRLEAAELYVQAARWSSAWDQARTYLEIWSQADQDRLLQMARYGSPSFDRVVELAVRSGHWAEADRTLARLERRWTETSLRSNADRHVMRRLSGLAAGARRGHLATALRTYGVDRDVIRFVGGLRRELARAPADPNEYETGDLIRLAGFAAAAGAPGQQLELLGDLRQRVDGAQETRVLRHTMSVMEELGAMRELGRLAAGSDLPDEERLPVLLRAAASTGDREAEEQLLGQLLAREREPRFDATDPRFERLLILRWRGGEDSRSSIVELARAGDNRSGQVVNFLIERGDYDGARTALERFAGDGESLWLDTARARILLLRADRVGQPPDDWDPFARALDLRPIGQQVDRPANRQLALTGEGWARLAQPYGEALARFEGERPRSTRLLEHAGIELRPRSPQAHVRLANEALRRSEPDLAIAHFQLAQQLAPRSLSVADGLARAMSAAGRPEEALALWDRVLGACEGERCVSAVIGSMNDAGMSDQAVARASTYLRESWRSGSVSLAILYQLAELVGDRGRGRGGPLDGLVWDLWQMDRFREDLLEAAAGVSDRPLLLGRARGRYLRQGLRRMGPRSCVYEQWVRAYVAYLAEHDEHQPAVELIDRYFAERASDRWWNPPADLRLARARALLGLDQRDRALSELRDLARGSTTAQAVDLLRELGHEREAWQLQLEVAQERLAEGRVDRAIYLAAVEALLELGRGAEAAALARRAASRRADDPVTFRALADLLAEGGRPHDALHLRRILYRMERGDSANLLALARLELETNHPEPARRHALSLLARWAVPAEVEEGAAQLLVDLIARHRRQRGPVITALGDALTERSLDEDRALALARVYYQVRHRRQALAVLERSIREAASPWRSLQLLASWEARSDDLPAAARHLEAALVHSGGDIGVRQQLFLVRRRLDQHQAALAALGIDSDSPAGARPLEGLEYDEAIAFCAELSDSASQVSWWIVAGSYAREGLQRIDEDEDPERAQHERARLSAIQTQLDYHRAAASGRPWIRRGT